MKIGAIGIRTKIIVGDAATWYLVKKYLDNVVIKNGGVTPEDKEKLDNYPEIPSVPEGYYLADDGTFKALPDFVTDSEMIDYVGSEMAAGSVVIKEYVDEHDALKVDKVVGKGLSTEDYTTAEKSKVANVPLNTNAELGLKVDKVEGSSLVPDTEINKLAEYPEFEDLEFSHGDLTGKNSEAAFQHVDTTTIKETLAEADKVAIQDNVTGKVVLTPKSNLKAENLLYQYIHSGNKEVYISAIDYVTHTFTSIGHGLANGDQLNIKIIGEGIIEQIIPFSANPNASANQIVYYVINSTVDTFQISLTSGGAAVPTINKATQNFSLWRFERTNAINIDIINIPAIGFDIEILGDIGQIHRQIWINGNYLSAKGYVQNATSYQTTTQVVAGRFMYLRGRCNINVRRYGNITYINRKMVGINLEPTDSTKIKWVSSDVLIINTYPVETLTSIQLAEVRFTNGTILNVYKI